MGGDSSPGGAPSRDTVADWEEAEQYVDRSETHPDRVVDELTRLEDLLQTAIDEDEPIAGLETRAHAAEAFRNVAESHPLRASTSIGALDTVLREEQERLTVRSQIEIQELSQTVLTRGAEALFHLAQESPDAVADSIEVLKRNLKNEIAPGYTLSTFGLLFRSGTDEAVAELLFPELDQLASLFDHDSRMVRRTLTMLFSDLARVDADRLVDHLEPVVGRFKDDDAEVRQKAIRALASATDTGEEIAPYLDDLASFVDDDDPNVRQEALNTLGLTAREMPETVASYADTIRAGLGDENANVRLRTTDVLTEFTRAGYPEVVRSCFDELEELLEDENPKVRARVAFVILETKQAIHGDNWYPSSPQKDPLAAKAVVERPQPGVDYLPDEDFSYQDIKDIFVAIRSGDGEVRNRERIRLESIANRRPDQLIPHIETLIWLLDGEDEDQKAAIPALLEVTKHVPEDVASYIDELVEKIGEESREADVRGLLATVIAEIAEDRPNDVQDYLDDISDHLNDSDIYVSTITVEVFRIVAQSSPESVLQHLPALASLLTVDDEEVRYHTLQALSAVATEYPDRIVPYIDSVIDCITDESTNVRKAAMNTTECVSQVETSTLHPHLNSIRRALADDEQSIRRAAATTFAQIAQESPNTMDPLVDSLSARIEDTDPKVRVEAFRALARLAQARALAVSQLIRDIISAMVGNTIRQALDSLGHEGSSQLRMDGSIEESDAETYLSHLEPGSEPRVLLQLARVSPASLIPHLDSIAILLDDGSADVRNTIIVIFGIVAQDHPEAIAPYVDTLAAHLDSTSISDRFTVAATLGLVSREKPDAVTPYAETIAGLLDVESDESPLNVVHALHNLAMNRPDAVAPHVDALTICLDNDDPVVRRVAARTFQYVALEQPEAVTPHLDVLSDRLTDEHIDPRRAAFVALVRVAEEGTEAVLEHADAIQKFIQAEEDPVVRDDAIRILRAIDPDRFEVLPLEWTDLIGITTTEELLEVANDEPRDLLPHLDTIATGLEAEAQYLRGVSAQTIFLITQEHPGEVQPYVDALAGLLEEDEGPEIIKPSLQALALVADADPAAIAPNIVTVSEYVDYDQATIRWLATTIIRRFADEVPEQAAAYGHELADRLTDDEQIRREAIRGLGHISRERAEDLVPHVRKVAAGLEDENRLVKRSAAMVLGRMSRVDSDAVVPHADTIAELLPKDEVSHNAMLALGEIAHEHPDVVVPHSDAIAARLNDEDLERRRAATKSLIPIANAEPSALTPYINPLVERLEDDTKWTSVFALRTLVAIAAEFPEEVFVYTDTIADKLVAENHLTRQLAFAVLRELAMEDGEPIAPHAGTIAEGLDEEDIRGLAVETLSILTNGRPDVVESHTDAITDCLDDEVDEIRYFATKALAKIADNHPEAVVPQVTTLASQLKESEAEAHYAAMALGLVARDDPDAIIPHATTLVENLTNDHTKTRRNATVALKDLADRRPGAVIDHVDALADRLDDADDLIAMTAAQVLREIADNQRYASQITHLVPTLATKLQHREERVRSSVANAMASLILNESVDTIPQLAGIEQLLNGDASVSSRRAGVRLLAAVAATAPDLVESHYGKLRRRAKDNDIQVYVGVIDAIRHIGSEATVPPLKKIPTQADR